MELETQEILLEAAKAALVEMGKLPAQSNASLVLAQMELSAAVKRASLELYPIERQC